MENRMGINYEPDGINMNFIPEAVLQQVNIEVKPESLCEPNQIDLKAAHLQALKRIYRLRA
jgi:hypothetical protein